MSEKEQFIGIEKSLCLFNRLSVIIHKILMDEELSKSEEKIISQILEIKGLDKE